MRVTRIASMCLLVACAYVWCVCIAAAAPPSVDHTDNYTVVLTYGQTPHHIGYRAAGDVTGWNWWDSGSGMQQRNLILAMVLDKNAHPVSGLSQPCFSRSSARFRVDMNTYSWKADDDGIGNYSNDMDVWHWIPLDLSGHSKSELTFYTWYRITPGDFGYVMVSTDDGVTWTELVNYTGYQEGTPVKKTISLSAYDDQDILLAFNFVSDSSGADEGWYIDEIKVDVDGWTVPFFEWRLFGETIFADGASSAPPELLVNIAYPTYSSGGNTEIKLQEYSNGLYGGAFYYAYNDTYSGSYEIDFTNSINNTDPASFSATFDTTLWGCQARGCHDAWTYVNDSSTRTACTVIHPDAITSTTATNCLTVCHTPSVSQFLRATPVHLHEIVYGHLGGFVYGEGGWVEIFDDDERNVQIYRKTSVGRPLVPTPFDQPSHVPSADGTGVGCTDCHTNFMHDGGGGGSGSVTYPIAEPETLSGENITYGVHSNVVCEKCHGDLAYPAFTGNYSLTGTIGGYVPEFMCYEESTDTYIINVTGSSGINVTVTADSEFLLSVVGPIDNTTTGLQDLNTSDPWRGTYFLPSRSGKASFRTGGEICYPAGEHLNIVTFDSTPNEGTWIVRILSRATGVINYTVSSANHPIAANPIIHIPWRCSECHNNATVPAGCENATTNLRIPDWDNHGLAYTHTDFDDDGEDDVTCRACHNTLHDVGILDCVNCHRTPPGGHNAIFSDYAATAYTDCLRCHPDPHYEPELAAGGDCADCHVSGGMNATGGLPIIDREGFLGSVHANITGDLNASNRSSISRVCWGCHNDYSEQLTDPKHFRIKPDCEDCHTDPDSWNGAYLTPPQAVEHQPDGIDVTTPAANCTVCHNKSLVSGMPPSTNVSNRNPRNYISHYGRQRTDIIVDSGNASDCSYCHCDEENMFNVTFEDRNNTNITHGIGFDANCTDCHGYGRIHDEALSAPMMIPGNNSMCMNTACHSNDRKPWFIDNSTFDAGIHGGANCTDCHTPLPIRINGKISIGETVCYNFNVPEETKEMDVTLIWGFGDLNLTLKYPNGTEIDSSVLPDIKYVAGSNYECYRVRAPVSGTWKACVTSTTGTPTFRIAVDLLVKHPGTTPHECEVCHVTTPVYGAPQAVQHTRDATKVRVDPDCMGCHNKSEMILPHGYEVESAAANVSHYGKPRTEDIVIDGGAASDCSYCHVGGGNEFSDVFADPANADIGHGTDCAACHGYGRIHDDVFGGTISSNFTMSAGDVSMIFGNVQRDAIGVRSDLTWDGSDFDLIVVRPDACTTDGVNISEYATRHYNKSDYNIPKWNVTVNEDLKFNETMVLKGTVVGDMHEFISVDDPEDGTWYAYAIALNASGTNVTITINTQIYDRCMECHDPQNTRGMTANLTDGSAFESGIHSNLNGAESDINRSCWACHWDGSAPVSIHPGRDAYTPKQCDNETCHVTTTSLFSAPLVVEHRPNAMAVVTNETTASCLICHSNSMNMAAVHYKNTTDRVSHYGSGQYLIDTEDCLACHENDDIGRKWGNAPEPRNITRYESIEDATDIETTIRTGEVWKLKNDYEIVVGPISSAGDTVRINLSHKGTVVSSKVVRKGGVFEYETSKDWIRSKSNNDSDLYGTRSETYKHRRAEKSKYTTIVDLKVIDIMSSGMRGIVTFEGLVLKSRIHIESENVECYTCHINEYRHAAEDGDDYVVLRTTGADGETDDSDDITIGRLAINFTENERKILYAQTGWDLGYGYMLRASEIDLDGRKARVELSRAGRALESKVVHEGEMFMYNTTVTDPEGHTISDVTVFKMRITGVFR